MVDQGLSVGDHASGVWLMACGGKPYLAILATPTGYELLFSACSKQQFIARR
jgi:hypothetical protein